MKKNIIGATLFLLACFILWKSASPQLQLKNQSHVNMKAATQKINILQLRLKKLEQELNKLKKVIQVKSNGVEITTPGRLKLNGMNLELKSQMNMNLNAGLNLNMNGKALTSIKSGTTLNLNSGATMALKGKLIKLN